MALSERDRAVIDVEGTWWLQGASKATVVRSRLGLSLSRYNQLLADLVGTAEAEAYDPLVVRRVRRARDRRRWSVRGAHQAGTTGNRPRPR
jgi:hypothetical protein